ncbi:hypothetical protein ABEF92_007726 [Exophiala dermatitidis]|nr:hypothetical protein HRR75_001118 [Exophiala dermatitidis]KAJ4559691.1 hypothetical protein HRR78_000211 [Exophiala dermatitidis]
MLKCWQTGSHITSSEQSSEQKTRKDKPKSQRADISATFVDSTYKAISSSNMGTHDIVDRGRKPRREERRDPEAEEATWSNDKAAKDRDKNNVAGRDFAYEKTDPKHWNSTSKKK